MQIYIEGIANAVSAIFVNNVDADTAKYVDHFDAEEAMEKVVENIAEDLPFENITISEVVNLLMEQPKIQLAIDTAKAIIESYKEESHEWGDGTVSGNMRYNGLKQSDFIR